MAQQTSVSSLLDMTSSSNVVFLGEAGSGKSEIALNFAQALAELGGKPVHFFDLDMTKPLFRSRDRREALEALGVEVHYEAQFMDAPTLTGGVRQRLNDPHCCAVLDVGGDYIGARSIGGYAPLLNRDGTTVYYVINPFRPWSATLEHIDQVLGETLGVSHVELARLRLVGNPNLGPDHPRRRGGGRPEALGAGEPLQAGGLPVRPPGAVRRPAGGAALPGAPHPPVADLSLGGRAGAGRTVSPLFNSLQDAICKKEMSVWQKWKLWRSAARAAATA